MENYLIKVNDRYLKFTEDGTYTKHVNTENGALLTITAPAYSYNEKCTNSAGNIICKKDHSGLLTIMDEIRKTNQLFDYSFKKTDVITFIHINTDYTSLSVAGFLYFEDKVS